MPSHTLPQGRAKTAIGKGREERYSLEKLNVSCMLEVSFVGSQMRDFGLSWTGLTLLKALLGHSSFSRSRGGELSASCLTSGRSASSSFALTSNIFAFFATPFACSARPSLPKACYLLLLEYSLCLYIWDLHRLVGRSSPCKTFPKK